MLALSLTAGTAWASTAPPSLAGASRFGTSSNAADALASFQASHGALDTSARALGDPNRPTPADVQRAFARLGWRSDQLPEPELLRDPKIRQTLAFLNLPGTRLQTSQIPLTLQPGDPAPSAGAGIAPQTGSVSEHASAQAAQPTEVETLTVVICSMSAGMYVSGTISYSLGLWQCPVAVYNLATWNWYSLYTGSLIQGPDVGSNNLASPKPSGSDADFTGAGQSHHRSVHWGNTFCLSSCATGVVILHDT